MFKFKFSDIGEGLHEGTVGKIIAKVGDKISEGDALFSVETDKLTSDIPSPVDGVVTEVIIKEGETVHVGDITHHIDDGSSTAPEAKPAKNIAPTPKPPVKKSVNKVVNAQESEEQVDVVVIGAGPGGFTVVDRLGLHGKKVIIIEKEFLGGVCLNVGCIPTKTLLSGAKTYHKIKIAKKFGLDLPQSQVRINWSKMQKRKSEVVTKLNNGVGFIIKRAKAEKIIGDAEVVDANTVVVGSRIIKTKNIIIASGSSPIKLPLPGFEDGYDDEVIINSKQILSLRSIPDSLTIIGGGVIGVEFAFLFNELGTDVTIIEGLPHIIAPADGQIRDAAKKLLESKGIKIFTNSLVKEYKNGNVIFENNKQTKKINSELILVAVGRRPNNLGVDKTLGIELIRNGGIKVNDQMETNVQGVYAIGDVVGESMLAHTAYKHAHIVSEVLTGENIEGSEYKNRIPACIYTYPEISWVGKTEEELKAANIPYVSGIAHNATLGKALADDELFGFTKILVGKEYGEILGAHIINATSSDMISEIALAMESEATIVELANTIHPHPSTAEAIYEAAVKAKDKFLEIG